MTTPTYLTTLQDPKELEWFVNLLVDERVKSYLEIGAKFGGSLEAVAKSLPSDATIVAVDLPGGTRLWQQSREALVNVIKQCVARGQDAHVIWGDSTDIKIIDQVSKFAPFDAILIDANHTYEFVSKDWRNYSDMGRIIAFHDIAWRRAPEWVGTRIDVPQFWEAIRGSYRHKEARYCPTGKNNGIGVLWRT